VLSGKARTLCWIQIQSLWHARLVKRCMFYRLIVKTYTISSLYGSANVNVDENDVPLLRLLVLAILQRGQKEEAFVDSVEREWRDIAA